MPRRMRDARRERGDDTGIIVGDWGFRFFLPIISFNQQFQIPSILLPLWRYPVDAYDGSTASQRAKALRNRYAMIFHGQVIP